MEGRYWPCAGSPTCPQAKPTREWSQRQENSRHPQNYKRDLSGDATSLHPEPLGGRAKSSGPTPDCNSFPKGNAFSSPVQTGTDTQAVLAAPASAAVPAQSRGACPGEEHFASCRPAVYSVNNSMAWATVAGDTGKLRGHCPLPPATSATSPRMGTQTQGTPSIPMIGKGLHWGREPVQCSLRAQLFTGFPRAYSPVPKGAAGGHRLQGHCTAPGRGTLCPVRSCEGEGYLSTGVMVSRRWHNLGAQPRRA